MVDNRRALVKFYAIQIVGFLVTFGIGLDVLLHDADLVGALCVFLFGIGMGGFTTRVACVELERESEKF